MVLFFWWAEEEGAVEGWTEREAQRPFVTEAIAACTSMYGKQYMEAYVNLSDGPRGGSGAHGPDIGRRRSFTIGCDRGPMMMRNQYGMANGSGGG